MVAFLKILFIVSFQCLLTPEKQNIAPLLNADYNGWTLPRANLNYCKDKQKRLSGMAPKF